MNRTLFIVPVANFMIEKMFKLGDFIFSPPYDALINEEDPYTDTLNKEEFEQARLLVNEVDKIAPSIGLNSSFIIFEDESIKVNSIQDSFLLVNQISAKADSALDYFRLQECRVGKYDTLPGIAGITINGFKVVFQFDYESNQMFQHPGEVSFMVRAGIGLMPSSEPDKKIYSDPLYICCYGDRNDEVFNTCKNALRRVSEAMYMNNLSTAFIYLMSTIEMIASPEYIKFQEAKKKILPFISESKGRYENLSDYLFDLSKNKRTDMVHNGKSIYQLYDSMALIENELFKLTGIIVQYVEEVIKLDIKTREELETKRLELKSSLGI